MTVNMENQKRHACSDMHTHNRQHPHALIHTMHAHSGARILTARIKAHKNVNTLVCVLKYGICSHIQVKQYVLETNLHTLTDSQTCLILICIMHTFILLNCK